MLDEIWDEILDAFDCPPHQHQQTLQIFHEEMLDAFDHQALQPKSSAQFSEDISFQLLVLASFL